MPILLMSVNIYKKGVRYPFGVKTKNLPVSQVKVRINYHQLREEGTKKLSALEEKSKAN